MDSETVIDWDARFRAATTQRELAVVLVDYARGNIFVDATDKIEAALKEELEWSGAITAASRVERLQAERDAAIVRADHDEAVAEDMHERALKAQAERDEALAALRAMTDRWEPDCTGTDRAMWETARAILAKHPTGDAK